MAGSRAISSGSPVADRTVAGGCGGAAVPADGPWLSVLERTREVTRATSVIAVNGDGLAVAWIGLRDDVEASRIAAHVAKSFDLLDRLKYVGRLAECLCTMYWPEGTWLTAVRIAPKVSSVVTIAVVGPYTLVDRDRRRLRNTFVQLLETTWRS
jgi:hypothetical protein